MTLLCIYYAVFQYSTFTSFWINLWAYQWIALELLMNLYWPTCLRKFVQTVTLWSLLDYINPLTATYMQEPG